MFKFSDLTITSQLIDGQFPNYNAIFDNKWETECIIDKDLLIKNVKQVSAIDIEKKGSIHFEINSNKCYLSVDIAEGQKSSVCIDCVCSTTSMVFNVSAKYLLDSLNSLSGNNIKIEYIKPDSPIKFTGDNENHIEIVMPIKQNANE